MLARLGWAPAFEDHFAPYAADGLEPARVAVEHRGAYVLYTARGEQHAELAGRLRHAAAERGELPAVGDWVAITPTEPALVQAVLPRKTKFSRLAATDHGQTIEQVVAANVDVVLLVAGLDGDFNSRRLERYLTLGWESGAEPVVVLTKSDLCADPEAALLEVETAAIGVPVHAVSNVTGEGVDDLRGYFTDGRTVAALGSSGVGKSSLVNRLAGEELMATGDVRADGRGRHTTTNRQLLLLPEGGLFLDTPGMRELRLWESEEGLAQTFDDVAAAAARCRFADCSHDQEPGCGVRAALADGTLTAERYASWRKLEAELRHLAVKQDARLRSEARKEIRRRARGRRRVTW
ncbi:MAG TPA: ribosome small subunit-dependent GTPase A [Gaiellaceae bacterium]|nr:ribosome small subunit-dependent GTPase A [Gaiellaceae bacterium]